MCSRLLESGSVGRGGEVRAKSNPGTKKGCICWFKGACKGTETLEKGAKAVVKATLRTELDDGKVGYSAAGFGVS